jgi:hypothetical protein
MTVGPVTMGGNMRSRIRGGMKDNKISSRAQTAQVPSRAPYPRGQGNGLPAASDGQKPLAYICDMAPWATGMMLKLMPTTEMRPVPR